MNFTRSRHPARLLSLKPSFEISDSSIDSKLKVSHNTKMNYSKGNMFARVFNKPMIHICFIIETHLKKYGFNSIIENDKKIILKNRFYKAIQLLKTLTNIKLKIFYIDIGRNNKVQIRLEKIMKIFKSYNTFILLKLFGVWKISNYAYSLRKSEPASDSFTVYLYNTKRALRNISSIVLSKYKLQVFSIFSKIKSFTHFIKYRKLGTLYLINSIKRLNNYIKYRNIQFSFYIILNLSRESKIKLTALNSIIKTVGKDLNFRLQICFSH